MTTADKVALVIALLSVVVNVATLVYLDRSEP